jgi:hypothetical protein
MGTPACVVTRPDTDQSEVVGAVGEVTLRGRSVVLPPPPHAEYTVSQDTAAAVRLQLMRVPPGAGSSILHHSGGETNTPLVKCRPP